MSDRPCTCHPDDNPPVPCPQKFALSECKAAAPAPEPVATMYQHKETGRTLFVGADEADRYLPSYDCIGPLYLHPAPVAAPAPRFKEVYCSQCGGSFGPGNHGYSHCEDHMEAAPAPDHFTISRDAIERLCPICRDALLPATAPAPEPVAWQSKDDPERFTTSKMPCDRPHRYWTPLYTHPAPVAAPDAKTTDEIMALAQKCMPEEIAQTPYDALRAAVEQIVREITVAHLVVEEARRNEVRAEQDAARLRVMCGEAARAIRTVLAGKRALGMDELIAMLDSAKEPK